MARSVPRRALEPRGACQNAHTFNVLSDKHSHRFEEVNNYSRLMTRRFYSVVKGGLADRAFQPLTGSQRCPVSMRRIGQLQITSLALQVALGPNRRAPSKQASRVRPRRS